MTEDLEAARGGAFAEGDVVAAVDRAVLVVGALEWGLAHLEIREDSLSDKEAAGADRVDLLEAFAWEVFFVAFGAYVVVGVVVHRPFAGLFIGEVPYGGWTTDDVEIQIDEVQRVSHRWIVCVDVEPEVALLSDEILHYVVKVVLVGLVCGEDEFDLVAGISDET